MTDCIYFPYIGEGEDLRKPKGGELKMQKIQGRGDGKTLEIQREGVIKRQKSRGGGSYEITEIPRGCGDKKAKIQERPYKIIEIPRKFLGGASKLDNSRVYGKKQVLTPLCTKNKCNLPMLVNMQ